MDWNDYTGGHIGRWIYLHLFESFRLDLDNIIDIQMYAICFFLTSRIRTGPIHTIGYTLKGLMPASVYEVAVLSRNRFGWSDTSRIIRFATSGESEYFVWQFFFFWVILICIELTDFNIPFLVELPNYSTESNEEENNYEDDIQNFSDDSSSSGFIPDPTMDIIENNDLYDSYHSMATKHSQTLSLLIASIVLIYSLTR